MPTVGIRELKNRLSFYLKRVMNGERIEVTHWGKVIALLIPARTNKTPRELLTRVEEGLASWGGGRPVGFSQPVEIRSQPFSDLILRTVDDPLPRYQRPDEALRERIGFQGSEGTFRKGSRRFRRGAPLCDPAGDRRPRYEGEAYRDHEFLYHEYTASPSGRGFTGGG